MIFKKGIRQYVFVPLAINLVLFVSAIYFGIGLFEDLMTQFLSTLPEWLQWLEWLAWLGFAILALLIIFYTFFLIANLISSPFNGALSAAVEQHFRPQSDNSETNWSTIFKEFFASLAMEVQKITYFLTFAILIGLIAFIPIINIAAPVIWFLFGAWSLSLQYIAYPLENHGHNFKAQKQYCRQQRLPMFGFGLSATVMAIIPILNCFAVPACVAGATKWWLDHDNK